MELKIIKVARVAIIAIAIKHETLTDNQKLSIVDGHVHTAFTSKL